MDPLEPSWRAAGKSDGVPVNRMLAFALALALSVPAYAAPAQSSPLSPVLESPHPLERHQVGQLLLHELRCFACHGPLPRQLLPPRAAPDLDEVGARVAPDFLRRFLADPGTVRPGTTMPDVLSAVAPEQRDEVATALTAFLVSRSTEPFIREPIDEHDAEQGRELFHAIGCLACHASPSEEALRQVGLDLQHVKDKYSLRSLTRFLFQPTRVRPSGRMPDMNLTRDEARFLASYLVGTGPPVGATPGVQAELVDAGRAHFEELRCAACHELDGIPDAAASRSFAYMDPMRGCLAEAPRGVPDFHLDDEQRNALRAALATPGADPSNEDRIALTLTAFRCIACHERDDLGGVTEILDPYFTTTQNDLGNEARIPPPLTGIGAKLRPEWMRRVLFDAATVRPYMNTRMPQFGEDNLRHLPQLLERVDRAEPLHIEEPQGDARGAARDAGSLLLGDRGLSCITCHDFNSKPSPGFRGMDLIGSFERLQPRWFFGYMISPQRFRPGTVMPSYWPDRESMFPHVLEGDTQAQIEAIWFVLSLGRSAPDPSGIHSQGSRLQVADTTRTYRGRSGIAGYRGIAVGFPGGLNYAFDAETGALSGIWRRDFVNVRWDGQGAGDFSPAGRAVALPRDLALLRLDDLQEPWPLLPNLDDKEPVNTAPLYPGNHGYQFAGYRLDAERVPTFLYRSEEVDVQDRSFPQSMAERSVLRRTLHLTSPDARTLHLRVLSGGIQRVSATQFQTANLRIDVPEVPALLRPNSADPSTSELLLRLDVPAGESTWSLDYEVLR